MFDWRLQEVPNYLRGYHNCSDKDAGHLAAYIYRAQFGDDMSALSDFEWVSIYMYNAL